MTFSNNIGGSLIAILGPAKIAPEGKAHQKENSTKRSQFALPSAAALFPK